MISVGTPYIEHLEDYSSIRCVIVNQESEESIMYFEVPDCYADYLVTEVADAFVLGVLLKALQTGNDIYVQAPLSERFYYNTINYLIPTLSAAFHTLPIKVSAEKIVNVNFAPEGVAAACSLGIDSFFTIFKHLSDDCIASYKLTHLTFFNVGAFGNLNQDKNHQSFLKDLPLIQECAKSMGLPLVTLESNISAYSADTSYDACLTLRISAAVLAMQKLFRIYFIGSGHTIAEMKLNEHDMADYETLLAPMLSTNNTEILIDAAEYSRPEKIRYLADFDIVKKQLYVCWRENIMNDLPDENFTKYTLANSHALNCGRCNKCIRTTTVLDALGKLDDFSGVFDLQQYKKTRIDDIAQILAYKHQDETYQIVYDFWVQQGFQIPLASRVKAVVARVITSLHLGKMLSFIYWKFFK